MIDKATCTRVSIWDTKGPSLPNRTTAATSKKWCDLAILLSTVHNYRHANHMQRRTTGSAFTVEFHSTAIHLTIGTYNGALQVHISSMLNELLEAAQVALESS